MGRAEGKLDMLIEPIVPGTTRADPVSRLIRAGIMDFQRTGCIGRVNQLRDGQRQPPARRRILLSTITGRGRTYIMAFGRAPLTSVSSSELADLLQRRKQGRPIAYLTGLREILVAAALRFSRHANPAPGYQISGAIERWRDYR